MANRKSLYLGSDVIKEVDPLSDGLSANGFVLQNTSYGLSTDGTNLILSDLGGSKYLSELGRDLSLNIAGTGTSGADFILLKGGMIRHNGYLYATYGGSSDVWGAVGGIGVDIQYQIGSQEIDGTAKANNTPYYLYVDTQFLNEGYAEYSPGNDTNLFVRKVTPSDIAYSKSTPESGSINLDRFLPVGVFGTNALGNLDITYNSYISVVPREFDNTWQWRNIGYVTRKTTFTSGGVQTYTHNLAAHPDVIQLSYFDGSVYTPLNNESYVSDITDVDIDFDFTGLTFGSGQQVQMSLAWYEETFNPPTDQWASDWITSIATTTVLHKLKNIPTSFSLVYDNNGTYQLLDTINYLVSFDNTQLILDWTGLLLDSTHKVKIYTSTGPNPSFNPFKAELQDYTTIQTVGVSGQQYAGHTFVVDESGTGVDLALYQFMSGNFLTDSTTHTKTLVNSTTVGITGGIFGGADGGAHFDGANYLYQGTLIDTMPSGAVDIDFWISVDDGQPSTIQYLFKKVNVTGTDYMIGYLDTTGKIIFKTRENGNPEKSIISQTTLPNGPTGFYLLSFNWDITNGMRLAVNGSIEASSSTATTLMASGTSEDFLIGSNSGGTNLLTGKIALFRVRNKILVGKKDFDLAYSVKYNKTSNFFDDDYIVTIFAKEDGDDDFVSELSWAGLEVARRSVYMYRYGGVFGANDKIRLVARY